jgi:hypothetical protein
LITFEIDQSCETLEIHLNDEGLDELVRRVERLRSSSESGHDHLLTPAWGGTELTESKQNASTKLINKVTVFLWRK